MTFVTKKRLTEYSNYDAKPSKSGNRPVDGARLGRPSELTAGEWRRRYKRIRRFLQIECGKIEYELKRVKNPQEVQALFRTLPNRGPREESVETIVQLLTTTAPSHFDPRDARFLRQAMKRANRRVEEAWLEYHKQGTLVEKWRPAIESANFEFGAVAQLWPFFYLLSLYAQQLGFVDALEARSRAAAELKSAQGSQSEIANLLLAAEAARAQGELLRFVANTRYETSRENFAAVMAGLPELSWITSLRRYRKCHPDNTPVQTNCEVLQFCQRVLQNFENGTELLDATRLETVIREKILELEPHGLSYHLRWNWGDLRRSIAQLDGMKITRAQLPYILTSKFEDNIARPKSLSEVALADRDRMEVWSSAD